MSSDKRNEGIRRYSKKGYRVRCELPADWFERKPKKNTSAQDIAENLIFRAHERLKERPLTEQEKDEIRQRSSEGMEKIEAIFKKAKKIWETYFPDSKPANDDDPVREV